MSHNLKFKIIPTTNEKGNLVYKNRETRITRKKKIGLLRSKSTILAYKDLYNNIIDECFRFGIILI